jgi:ribosome-associated toxin RatA of RatAB toxin-antitoxin module
MGSAPGRGLSLLLVLVACGAAVGAWAHPTPELSETQRQRLAAREVVVLDTLPPGASPSARGGTGLAIVRATPEQVWRVLTDYRGHPRYYPRVVTAEVVEAHEQRVLVRYTVGIGPLSFDFHMNKYPDVARRRIQWQLADGHSNKLFRENSGYWQVDGAADAALVTYAIAVRTVLPSFMTGGAERDSVGDTITALRAVVEGDNPR